MITKQSRTSQSRFNIVMFSFIFLFFILLTSNVSAIIISENFTFIDGEGDRYTLTQDINISYIYVTEKSLIIDGTDFCFSDMRLLFNTTNQCTVEDIEIEATNTTKIVFGAFVIISIMIFVAIAIFLINMFQGSVDSSTMLTLIIMVIAVGVFLVLGYFILSTIASSIFS